MIDIKSDKDKVIRSIQELEFEFAQGNISKKTYNSQKKDLASRLETLEAADRIKRLQGKGEVEKPLEYWTEKKEEEMEKQAKEELMKKFITSSSPSYPSVKTDTNGKKRKAVLTAMLALIFIAGIGFGAFLMKIPSESTAVPMTINQSAFPAVANNTTNMTNTTSSTTTNITQSSSTGSGSTVTNTPSNSASSSQSSSSSSSSSNPSSSSSSRGSSSSSDNGGSSSR